MNQEVLNIFNPVQAAPTFDQIRIALASPELQERICLEDASPISIASKLLISIT